jgi:hypothetical protein
MKLIALSAEFQEELSSETISRYGSVSVAPLEQPQTSEEGPIVYVDGQLEPADVIYQVIEKKCNYLLQKNDGYFDQDLVATAGLAEQPVSYFSENFQFSPEPVLKSLKIDFSDPSDKESLKQQSLEMIASLNSGTALDSSNAVIEELYMNALFDAPREAAKMNAQISARSSQLELIQTERFLQISCTDHYGSLDVRKFLQRMNDVYRNGAGPMMSMEPNTGAGLGCVILFEHSSCVILGVQPGVQTKVTCLIPIGISNLRRTQMKKSLHWFHI